MRCAITVVAVLAVAFVARAGEEDRAKSASCGDNVVQAGEECDGSSDSACPGMCDGECQCPPATTLEIDSHAHPANTPGSPHVSVSNPKLLTQFGKRFSLNKATYTRYRLCGDRDSERWRSEQKKFRIG